MIAKISLPRRRELSNAMNNRQISDAKTDNQRFLSVNYKREKTLMDLNRKVHSSPIKVYRRFSEYESKPKSEVRVDDAGNLICEKLEAEK